MKNLSFLILIAGTVGCASYEYDVTRPQEMAAHVAKKVDTKISRDPLEYRMRTVDNRLVVQIYNPTDEQITLQGQQSSVVDPQGQSHPLRSATMASRSFIKIILPPMRPSVRDSGPSFGIGVGTIIGDNHRRDYGVVDSPIVDEPRYLAIVDESDAYYWDWKDQGEIRLMLVYDRGGKTFSHEFVIDRRKM